MQVLTSSRARSFAETTWGRGGTHSAKTNRKGVYYFSCSSHGGYVVDGMALTEEERAEIDKYVKPKKVLVCSRNGKPYFVQNPHNWRKQSYRVYSDMMKHEDYLIYFFEEDCDWAVLEKFTDIRLGRPEQRPDDNWSEKIERTFDQWHKHKVAA